MEAWLSAMLLLTSGAANIGKRPLFLHRDPVNSPARDRRESKMKKFIPMYVSLVACLMFAGVATAAPVVYTFTVDGDVIGGTITIDVGSPADSSGGVDTYILGVCDNWIEEAIRCETLLERHL